MAGAPFLRILQSMEVEPLSAVIIIAASALYLRKNSEKNHE